MQLVGEVLGQVSDQLNKAGVWGFDDNSITGNIGRDLLEAGGTAAVAAATGGNVGASVASVIGGKIGGVLAGDAVGKFLGSQFGNNAATELVGNMIMNAGATGAGAALGAAVGGSAGAFNGANIASIINQYNETANGFMKKLLAEGQAEAAAKVKAAEEAMHMTQAYGAAFKDDGTGYYNADKTVNTNNVPPPNYRLPTEDELRNNYGIDGYKGLSEMLDRPKTSDGEQTDVVGAIYMPEDPNNESTSPMLVFQGSKSGHDFRMDWDQAIGLPTEDYQVVGEIGDNLRQHDMNNGGVGSPIIIGGESLGGALAEVTAEHSGMDMIGYNSASVHPNSMPENILPHTQDQWHVTGEGLFPLETVAHDASAIIIVVLGIGNVYHIVPGPIENAPDHGVYLHEVAPAPGTTSWIPGVDLYNLHTNKGGAEPASVHYFHQEINNDKKLLKP